jgi:hypothetical protein
MPYCFTTPPPKFSLDSAKASECCRGKCRKVSPGSSKYVVQEEEQEEPLDMEAIWEEALQCKDATMGSSSESDSEDEWDFATVRRQSKPIMVKLPCGDIHLYAEAGNTVHTRCPTMP